MPSATSRGAVRRHPPRRGADRARARVRRHDSVESSVGSRQSLDECGGVLEELRGPAGGVRVRAKPVVFGTRGGERREAANREHDDARASTSVPVSTVSGPQGRERCPGLSPRPPRPDALVEVRAPSASAASPAEVGGELARHPRTPALAKERPARGSAPREGGRATSSPLTGRPGRRPASGWARPPASSSSSSARRDRSPCGRAATEHGLGAPP